MIEARAPAWGARAPAWNEGATQAVWAAAVAVVTALWVVAALADGDPAPVDTTAMGAAAAAGTAAAVGAGWAFGPLRPAWLAGLALVLLPVAAAAGTEGSVPVLAIVLLVLVIADVGAALARAEDEPVDGEVWLPAGLVLVATALLVAALAAGHDGNGRWALTSPGRAQASFALAAAAVLLAAAALGPPRGRGYAGPALVVGLVAAPGLQSLTLAVLGGSLAVVSAGVLGRRPGTALGFLALGAAGFSAGRPAAALLAAGAVLALAYAADHPAAALLGAPGASLLATAVLASGDAAAPIVVALAAAASAVLLALSATREEAGLELGEQPWALVPVALLAAWLFLAPGTWAWTGSGSLELYDRGAAAAVAGGLAVVVARWALGLRRAA